MSKATAAGGRRGKSLTRTITIELPDSAFDERSEPNVIHGFAVVRADDPDNINKPIEWRVTLKRIVFERNIAEAEAVRLNNLNANNGCQYFCQHARIELPEPPQPI
jgi:hypothetical protein